MHDTAPAPRTVRRRDLLILLTIVLLAKIILISGHEVIAGVADTYGYVGSAAGLYWGNAYDIGMNSRQPVFPVFVGLNHLLGIPFRLTIEVVYVLSSALFGLGILRATRSRLAGLLCFVLTAFYPSTFREFDEVMSDTLFTCLSVSLLGLILLLVVRMRASPRTRSPLRDGVAWSVAGVAALACNTRPEGGLVLIPLVAAVVAVALASYETKREAIKRSVLYLAPVIIAVTFLTGALATANYFRFGYFATYDMNLPGFLHLNRTLLRIRPERSARFSPVPKDVREKAYRVSPSFRRLQEELEGPTLKFFSPMVASMNGLRDSHGTWWIWALKWSAATKGLEQVNVPLNGAALDGYYEKCAKEIDAALDSGMLPSRIVISSLVDPDTSNWLPYVPESFGKYLRMVAFPPQVAQAQPPPNVPREIEALFDHVAVRRSAGFARPEAARLTALAERIAAAYGWWSWVGAVAIPLAMVIFVTRIILQRRAGRARWLADALFAAGAFVLFASAIRLVFFSVVDAVGFPAAPRYALPASAPLHAAIALVVLSLWRSVRKGLLGRSSSLRSRHVQITDLPSGATESTRGFCLVCNQDSVFDSWEPVTTECKRNTFVCRHCKSVARNRHLARTILDIFPTQPRARSLFEFVQHSQIRILHTCASGAIHETLKHYQHYHVSEFYEGVPSGTLVNGVECQNLEQTSFPDASFDLVITEEVLEHVADPERACRELRRILTPGGAHVSTIAVYWGQPQSTTRAVLYNGCIEHLLPPVYHGDPNRREGALVFVDFGADIVDRYLSLTGSTEVLWSNGVKKDERCYAIYNNMVFVSRVPIVTSSPG